MHCAHFSARRNSQSTEVVWPKQTAASLPGEWVPRLGVLKGTQPGYPPGSPGGIALSKWGPVWSGPEKEYIVRLRRGPQRYTPPSPISPNRVYRLGDTPLGVTRLRL